MSTHAKHELPGTYFVTFTCYRWIPLIKITQAYDLVYKWFEVLQGKGVLVFGYVIMPNHVHCLIHVKTRQNLNKIIGNGKRFLAYEIVKRLYRLKKVKIISYLELGVKDSERRKGKKHQVFKLSFDAKLIESREMLEKTLDYIHYNPVKGKWNLAFDFMRYPHSSAS